MAGDGLPRETPGRVEYQHTSLFPYSYHDAVEC
ncbi:predicted protein [Chaetomium globosum CBS 148.51]|uniref:Uncharacterized protein n=1 Tax=Chaetomium globosum (strain ATCC 6205 / CBS 148.51 / DSM 1962 / NBRC 6347 / NRRL 1970) TaxID=306901 RepID=Q2HCR6_CHAGB|nr:uncharacterized protein CHGG_01988 [Chaetomium globosum CBS 148.51]EAQ93753.1 predicted protein [Chaetomium globosum CBS 148.51]